MKRNARLLALMLIAMVVVTSLAVTVFAKAKHVTVTGTINEKGALVGDNGKTCTITQNDKGKELAMMVGKKVEVTGRLKGKSKIEVSTYKEIK